MALTKDEFTTWLKGRIAAFGPQPELDASEVSRRLRRLVEAAAIRGASGMFGLDYRHHPKADELQSAARPLLDQAVEDWQTWLRQHHGEEGHDFFVRVAESHGLLQPTPKVLANNQEVAAALARLTDRLSDAVAATESWRQHDWLIDETDVHAWGILPPSPEAGRLLAQVELPPALEGLYAEIDGLWTGSEDPPGGKLDDGEIREREDMIFVSLEHMLECENVFDGMITLKHEPGDWMFISLEDGGIYQLDRSVPIANAKPVKLAPSLSGYLDLLAETYGRPHASALVPERR